jgi:hypothetical protein
MGRPRFKIPGLTIRELVQQQRSSLYAAGNRNLNMAVSLQTLAQIDRFKRLYRLRSRDAIVARVIASVMTRHEPDRFVERAAVSPDMRYRWISPIIAIELIAFVKAVQARFRNMSLGGAFELIFAEIGEEQAIREVQLTLAIQEPCGALAPVADASKQGKDGP